MVGGVLQLLARSSDDFFLTVDPKITLFKTIYRRYTLFSSVDHKLTFNKDLNFGTESVCIIKKLGDLLHHLYLVIELPEIEPYIKGFTKQKVKEILKTYDIVWDNNKNLNDLLTDDDFNIIKEIINNKIIDTNQIIDTNNKILNILHNIQDYNINNILSDVMTIDQNYLQYSFIQSLLNDTINPNDNTDLYNIDEILYICYYKALSYYCLNIKNIDIYFNGVFFTTITSYVYELIELLSIIYLMQFNTTYNMNNLSSFNLTIQEIYNKKTTVRQSIYNNITQLDVDYTHIDGYITSTTILQNNLLNITNNTISSETKNMLTNNIQANFTQNIQILTNLFTLFLDKYSFVVFK